MERNPANAELKPDGISLAEQVLGSRGPKHGHTPACPVFFGVERVSQCDLDLANANAFGCDAHDVCVRVLGFPSGRELLAHGRADQRHRRTLLGDRLAISSLQGSYRGDLPLPTGDNAGLPCVDHDQVRAHVADAVQDPFLRSPADGHDQYDARYPNDDPAHAEQSAKLVCGEDFTR